MAPPGSDRKSDGAWLKKPLRPSKNGEFVISRISQPSARFCIHVPMFERKFPPQNSAKSRERSERNIVRKSLGGAGGAAVGASVGFGGADFIVQRGRSQT